MKSPVSWSSDQIFRQFDRMLDEMTGVWVVGRVLAGGRPDYALGGRYAVHKGSIRRVRPNEYEQLSEGDQER